AFHHESKADQLSWSGRKSGSRPTSSPRPRRSPHPAGPAFSFRVPVAFQSLFHSLLSHLVALGLAPGLVRRLSMTEPAPEIKSIYSSIGVYTSATRPGCQKIRLKPHAVQLVK